MPTPVLKPVTSWSFSRWSDYEQCPARFMYKHLLKLPEPPSDAMERGNRIHKLAEDYAKGKLTTLPAELSAFKEEFRALKAQKTKIIEDQWTWTKEWAQETAWNDWNNAWVRIKLDAAYLNTKYSALVVIDHKTGRYRPEDQSAYLQQLELYGLAGLVKFPDAKVVSPRLWYLDAGVIYPDESEAQPLLEYKREDEPKLRKVWLARVKPMFNDKTYKPKPNDRCKWCTYRNSNGGPCRFA